MPSLGGERLRSVSSAGGISRRALLTGAGAALLGGAGLAGCTSGRSPAPSDPDAAALEAARQGERALLANYAGDDPSYRTHLAHLHALGGSEPTPTATSSVAADPRVAAAAEAASVPALQAAAVAAASGHNAALLASIAACHAALARA